MFAKKCTYTFVYKNYTKMTVISNFPLKIRNIKICYGFNSTVVLFKL